MTTIPPLTELLPLKLNRERKRAERRSRATCLKAAVSIRGSCTCVILHTGREKKKRNYTAACPKPRVWLCVCTGSCVGCTFLHIQGTGLWASTHVLSCKYSTELIWSRQCQTNRHCLAITEWSCEQCVGYGQQRIWSNISIYLEFVSLVTWWIEWHFGSFELCFDFHKPLRAGSFGAKCSSMFSSYSC